MKRLAALLCLLLATGAQAQQRQPASITTIPSVTPQTLYWLDSTGAWQNLPTASSSNAWTGTNTFQISNIATFKPNNVVLGSVTPPNTLLTTGLYVGPATFGGTGNLNQGIYITTNPGNIENGLSGVETTPGTYKVWNTIYPIIDSYWTDPAHESFNVGLVIEARLNQSGPTNAHPVNGHVEAILGNASIYYAPGLIDSSGNLVGPVTPGFKSMAVGGQFNATLLRTMGGSHTTLAATVSAGATSIALNSPTRFQTGDNITLMLDSGKAQRFNNITVSGSTVTWPSATPNVTSTATAGNAIYNAKGVAYGHSSIAQLGTTATDILEVTDTEENVWVPTGASVLYKQAVSIAATAEDRVQGTLLDAMIGLSAASGGTGGLGAVGWQDGILFHSFNGKFPISLSGGLMRVDGHSVAPINIGYGIDMTWAHFHASDGGSGNAFAFSVAGNGVADNYWSNTQLVVSGNIQSPVAALLGGLIVSPNGTSTNVPIGGAAHINQILGNIAASRAIDFAAWNAATGTIGSLNLAISHGAAPGSFSAVSSAGSDEYAIRVFGDDGATLNSSMAKIGFRVAGTVATGQVPGAIDFYTTPVGGSSVVRNIGITSTGQMQFFGGLNFSANGSVATTMTSLGPTGARTTVQKWLTVLDSAGNPFYIPAY